MNRDPSDTTEPNALDAVAHLAKQIAHAGAWAIILICLLMFWVGTP